MRVLTMGKADLRCLTKKMDKTLTVMDREERGSRPRMKKQGHQKQKEGLKKDPCLWWCTTGTAKSTNDQRGIEKREETGSLGDRRGGTRMGNAAKKEREALQNKGKNMKTDGNLINN